MVRIGCHPGSRAATLPLAIVGSQGGDPQRTRGSAMPVGFSVLNLPEPEALSAIRGR
jgi:hypothetical protein